MENVSEQEQQMVEIIRQWGLGKNHQLQIEVVDGVWDIALKEIGTERASHGTGATFEAAWDNVSPAWA